MAHNSKFQDASQLAAVAEQVGLSLTWVQISESRFSHDVDHLYLVFQNEDDLPKISRDNWTAALGTTQKSLSDKEVEFYEELNMKKDHFNFRLVSKDLTWPIKEFKRKAACRSACDFSYKFFSLFESIKSMGYFMMIWAAPSEFVSSSIPSWQTLTAHAQPFRGARDLAFCLKVPLDSLLVWASSEGSGETARMRRLAWTFAARIGDKYQIRLARPIY